MISFIIYDSDVSKREVYSKIIKNFLYTSQDYYTVYELDKYSNKTREDLRRIGGAKIYLINIDGDNSEGLRFAKHIRCDGDFISPILILTSKKRKEVVDHLRNILYMDILEIGDKLVADLLQSLIQAYKIVTRHFVYTFLSFDELYRLPYNDIYYIKKNLNDDSVTIYTNDDTYLNYVTIKRICENLEEDPRFFKVHRSCVINLFNVSSFDCKSNTIIFNNGMKINLVSRYNKSKLVKRLKDYDVLSDKNVI